MYTAQELIANGAPAGGGKIRAIWFYNYRTYNKTASLENFTMTMAHTSSTDLSTSPQKSDEKVVFARASYANPSPSNYSWYRMEFDEAFEWDGVSNIVISSCFSNPHTNYHWYMYVRYGYAGQPLVRYRYYYTFYGAPAADWCSTHSSPSYGPYVSTYRPDMRFEICNEDPLAYDMTVPTLQYLPGTVPVSWNVGRNTGSFTANVTLNLYRPNGTFVKSESFQVPVNADMKSGTYQFSLANVPAGYYRIEAVYNGLNECGEYSDHFVSRAVMILDPGSVPCEVWPGDVNNDGIVNYGDRASLHGYIYEANLRSPWLNGPSRYRVDLDINPLGYYAWEMQPAVPWQTQEGCYMDADGNGTVNNFDYIAVKMNWMRTHGLAPKSDRQPASTSSFAMEQNYPNPFNPTTSISYRLPERSTVRIVITDMLGREVATLIDGEVEAGTHVAHFDATGMSSGNYIARVAMTGLESGASYSNTMKMTLGK
jgi:hypothetical protein